MALSDDAGLGDSSAIEQVIASLVTNAARFSAAASPIMLRIGGRGEDVELVVSDRGVGVAPEDAEQIFDRFARSTGGRLVARDALRPLEEGVRAGGAGRGGSSPRSRRPIIQRPHATDRMTA